MNEKCPFCARNADDRVIEEDEGWYSKLDPYPVSPGHALLIPKAHVASLLDLDVEQGRWMLHMIQLTCRCVADLYAPRPVDGWTIAVNDGSAAGRTVPHLHVHLIPRYTDDVRYPIGGVRRMFIPDPMNDPWIMSRP